MASRSTARAQVPIRGQGHNTCPDHHSEVLIYCKDCNGKLVCLECITSTHQGHNFEKISEVASKKKQVFQDYVQKAESQELPRIRRKIESIEKQTRGNLKRRKSFEKRIIAQGEKLKTEIDKITKEYINTCREIEQSNSLILSGYKQELQSIYSQLSQRVDTCKETIESGNNITVIDVEKVIHKELKVPPAPLLQTVDFTEGQCPATELQSGVGSLSVQGVKTAAKGDIQQCSNKTEVVSSFVHLTGIKSIEKSGDGVWISYDDDRYISLLDVNGKIIEKVQLGVFVKDISVAPATGNLWMACNDNSVYELLNKTLTKRFTTQYQPICLCVTPDDMVVLCLRVDVFDYSVIVYNTRGVVTRRISGVELALAYPRHISVCSITGDIAVCDEDDVECGGNGKPHVSIYNSKFVSKYRCYGQPKLKQAHMAKPPFRPYDSVYDLKRRLLVADFFNKCIHLVSSEGQSLTMFYTDMVQRPVALALIQDDQLCIGFEDRTVKTIKYKR